VRIGAHLLSWGMPPPTQSTARSVPTGPAPTPKPSQVPTLEGRFGAYGGQYVPETLMAALQQLDEAYTRARNDSNFWDELQALLKSFVGRPTPLYFAEG